MNKLILKILITLTAILMLFIFYLGASDFIINPRLIESEFSIED